MRHIGFKNFRKFSELNPIEFAPITILVGGNNSGKSTLVKGLLLLNSFLNHRAELEEEEKDTVKKDDTSDPRAVPKRISHNQRFYFNDNYYAHIGTIQRAMNNESDDKHLTFKFGLNNSNWNYEVVVEQDVSSANATSGKIVKVREINRRFDFEITYDLKEWEAEITFYPISDLSSLRPLKSRGEESTKEQKFNERLDEFYGSFSEPFVFKVKIPEIVTSFIEKNIIALLNSSLSDAISSALWSSEERERASEDRPFRRNVLPEKYIPRFSPEVKEFLRRSVCWDNDNLIFTTGPIFALQENIEYVYAHAVSQTVIYGTNNTDYVVKTIQEFADLKINKDAERNRAKKKIYAFITAWMANFDIGTDYNIESFGGEAYLVKITGKNGKVVNLADMGMGSIQLMILLFRLGILMFRIRRAHTTIILEEPEQNIHPKLQSKLAELFCDIIKLFKDESYGYRVRFIVETHSEYLIRSSQVIVGKDYNTDEKLKANPFKVFYFPSDGSQPYDMEYTATGKFARKFGEGFFDAASNLQLEILRNANR